MAHLSPQPPLSTPLFSFRKGEENFPFGATPDVISPIKPNAKLVEYHLAAALHVPTPPASTDWWEREIQWMKDRDVAGNKMPADMPFQGALQYQFAGGLNYGPFTLARRVQPWPRLFDNSERAWKSEKAPRDENNYPFDAGSLSDIAVVCHNDIGGQFFVESAVELAKDFPNTPGHFFSGNATPTSRSLLDTMSKIWNVHQAALNDAFKAKWMWQVARPEEVFARLRLPLKLVYPEGAPLHPAYPSGHAACAGAGLFVLLQMMGDIKAETVAGKNLVHLAELTFLGRWIAGIHWVADGIGGLDAGWNAAQDIIGTNHNPSPWAPLMEEWD